jgi:hypothetical protein
VLAAAVIAEPPCLEHAGQTQCGDGGLELRTRIDRAVVG